MSLFHFSLTALNYLAFGSEQLSNIEVQKMMTKTYLTIWHKSKTFLRKTWFSPIVPNALWKVSSSLVVVWLYKLWFADSTLWEIHYMHNSQRRIPGSGLAHKKMKSVYNHWSLIIWPIKSILSISLSRAFKFIAIFCFVKLVTIIALSFKHNESPWNIILIVIPKTNY